MKKTSHHSLRRRSRWQLGKNNGRGAPRKEDYLRERARLMSLTRSGTLSPESNADSRAQRREIDRSIPGQEN